MASVQAVSCSPVTAITILSFVTKACTDDSVFKLWDQAQATFFETGGLERNYEAP